MEVFNHITLKPIFLGHDTAPLPREEGRLMVVALTVE